MSRLNALLRRLHIAGEILLVLLSVWQLTRSRWLQNAFIVSVETHGSHKNNVVHCRYIIVYSTSTKFSFTDLIPFDIRVSLLILWENISMRGYLSISSQNDCDYDSSRLMITRGIRVRQTQYFLMVSEGWISDKMHMTFTRNFI